MATMFSFFMEKHGHARDLLWKGLYATEYVRYILMCGASNWMILKKIIRTIVALYIYIYSLGTVANALFTKTVVNCLAAGAINENEGGQNQ